jgi:2-polyprenyl-3-methyl-5-hydroxy-6-metoxy-1,4-benzoquinol methylase
MFVKNKKDDEVKSMYMSAPYPFVSMDNFKKFKEQFEIDLDAVIDIGDLNGKIILDAGCGTGEKACILAEYAKKVVGIDFSGESIKLAQKNSFILDRKNTLFFEDSLLDLKNIKDDELFDVILCSGVLHHLSDPYLGFRNIIKHLKPQGILILSLYHPLGLMEYNIKYKCYIY